MNTKEKVLEFMSKNTKKPMPTNKSDLLACPYLDIGIIDSLGIVMMITEFESAFDIRFDAEDMQSNEFQTIGGLITIIDRLRAAAK
jgi:acyl carrier protein